MLARSVFLNIKANMSEQRLPNSAWTLAGLRFAKPIARCTVCRPFPRYGWFGKHRAKVACTYQSLAFNFYMSLSGDRNNNSSVFFSMHISNQSIVNQNYIENEDLVSTVDFCVQSTVSWERSNLDDVSRHWIKKQLKQNGAET